MTTKFYFTCACGCGQISEDLGKDYIRLREDERWYKEGDEGKEFEIVKDFKGGKIVKLLDF